jgi:DNA-3-methyladenine glycosylase II
VRALTTPRGVSLVEVRQASSHELEVQIIGESTQGVAAVISRMLGVDVNLREWYERVKPFPWLAQLSKRFRGVKPPRYPDLWEALCHGIVFQQISITAAAAIMQRLVELCSAPLTHADLTLYPFPLPGAILKTSLQRLQTVGLSRMKAAYLVGAAEALVTGTLREDRIASMPTREAAAELEKLHGVGPWSAAVVLLRGMGRLDTFPLNDSGVRRSIKALSGDPEIDIDALLSELGDLRGMLYFHLLLGRRSLAETLARR